MPDIDLDIASNDREEVIPVRVQEVRRALRSDGLQRRHLPGALSEPRDREGAGLPRRHGRSHVEIDRSVPRRSELSAPRGAASPRTSTRTASRSTAGRRDDRSRRTLEDSRAS
jgi:hypothetical protein